MDKNIPLSELIRIGSKVSGKCRRCIRDTNGNTCALGAALIAKRGELPSVHCSTTDAALDLQLTNKIVTHPIVGGKRELVGAITWLNDHEGWTREEIADWLEKEGL